MYEQDFGLTKRLFLAKATGGDVFVGPQTAQTMVGLKKALLSQDATVLVSGPAGTGKTTLVSKSLEALAATHKSIRLGRMRLGGADILEFLLEELGAEDLPRGPIRQFGVLREQLRQLQTNNMRVVVVVEDALHTGAETLAELEALTAADAGDSGGAAIVLMGNEGLPGFLQDAELARLAQRIRLQHSIKPMCAAELRGYLMHCFRLAETDFEHIFDATSAALLHDLSGGIPRIANNIVESAMTAAAAADINPIPSSLVATIAKDEFHLEAKVVSQPAALSAKAAAGAAETELVPEPEEEPDPAEIPELEAIAVPMPEHPSTDDPVIVFSDETGSKPPLDDDDIPELIQDTDTFPILEVLPPEAIAPDAETVDAPLPDLQPEYEPGPAPASEPAPGGATDGHVPAWERDPTLAQLRPDLDALEKAMAFAHGERSGSQASASAPPIVETEVTPDEQEFEDIPEITLDNAIQSKIEDSLIDEPGQISPNDPESSASSNDAANDSQIKFEPRRAKKADAQLEKIAEELAKAKTIEDCDDTVAETLFGEELNFVAAQVVDNGPANEPGKAEEVVLFDSSAAMMAQGGGSPSLEISLETRQNKIDASASQRLKTVRALNADRQPSPAVGGFSNHAPSTEPSASIIPDPIEDQINTSMTQTLKALDVKPPISDKSNGIKLHDDEGISDEKDGGFFSRFKRP
jgi:type II secretory pathway predicted ATPase ExeA